MYTTSHLIILIPKRIEHFDMNCIHVTLTKNSFHHLQFQLFQKLLLLLEPFVENLIPSYIPHIHRTVSHSRTKLYTQGGMLKRNQFHTLAF